MTIVDDPDKKIEGELADDESNKRAGPKSKRKHKLGVRKDAGAASTDVADLDLQGPLVFSDTDSAIAGLEHDGMELNYAALKLQSVYRGHLGRNLYYMLLGDLNFEHEHAALVIQCAFRSYRARNEYYELCDGASEPCMRTLSYEGTNIPEAILDKYLTVIEAHATEAYQAIFNVSANLKTVGQRVVGGQETNDLEELVKENENLRSKLAEANDFLKNVSLGGNNDLKVQALEIQLEMKDEEIEEMQEDLDGKLKEIAKLREELQNTRSGGLELDNTLNKLAAAEAKMQELETTISELTAEKGASVQELQEKVEHLEEELDNEKLGHEKLKQVLNAEQFAHRETKVALKDHDKVLEDDIAKLQEQIENLKEALDIEQSAHKKTRDASQEKIENDIAKLQEQIEILKEALNTEQSAHNKTRDTSQDQVKALEDDIAKLQEQIESLKEALDTEQSANKKIRDASQDTVKAQEDDIAKLREQIENLQCEVPKQISFKMSLEAELRISGEENERLQAELTAVQAEDDALRRNVVVLQDDIAKLQEQIENLKEALDIEQSAHKKTRDASQEQIENDIAKLQEQIEILKEALNTEQSAHNKTRGASQDQVKALEDDIAKLQEQIESLKEALDTEQSANKKTRDASQDTVKAQEDDIAKLREQIENLQCEVPKQISFKMSLEAELRISGEENERLQAELTAVQADDDALRRNVVVLQDDIAKLQEKIESLKETEQSANNKTRDASQDHVKALEDDIAKLQEQIEILKEGLDTEQSAHKKTRDASQDLVKAQEDEIAKLQEQIENDFAQLQEQIENLQCEVPKQISFKMSLEAELRISGEENERLQAELTALQADDDALRRNVVALQDDIVKLQEQIESLKETEQSANNKTRDASQDHVKALEDDIAKLQEQIEILKEGLDTEQSAHKKTRDASQDLVKAQEDEIAKLQEQIENDFAQLQEQIENLQCEVPKQISFKMSFEAELRISGEENERLQAELTAVQADDDALRRNVVALQDDIVKLQEQIENLKEALDTEQSAHKKTRDASQEQIENDIAKLQEQIESLQEGLDNEQSAHNKTRDASQDHVKALEDDIAKLQEQIESLKEALDIEQSANKKTRDASQDTVKALDDDNATTSALYVDQDARYVQLLAEKNTLVEEVLNANAQATKIISGIEDTELLHSRTIKSMLYSLKTLLAEHEKLEESYKSLTANTLSQDEFAMLDVMMLHLAQIEQAAKDCEEIINIHSPGRQQEVIKLLPISRQIQEESRMLTLKSQEEGKHVDVNYQKITSLGVEIENLCSENNFQLAQLLCSEDNHHEYCLVIDELLRSGLGIEVALFKAVQACTELEQRVSALLAQERERQCEIEQEMECERRRATEIEIMRVSEEAKEREREWEQERVGLRNEIIRIMQQQSDGASEKDDAAREPANDTKLSAAKQATDEGASVSHLNLIIEEKERTVSVLKIAVQALQGQVQSVTSEMQTALQGKDVIIAQLKRTQEDWQTKHMATSQGLLSYPSTPISNHFNMRPPSGLANVTSPIFPLSKISLADGSQTLLEAEQSQTTGFVSRDHGSRQMTEAVPRGERWGNEGGSNLKENAMLSQSPLEHEFDSRDLYNNTSMVEVGGDLQSELIPSMAGPYLETDRAGMNPLTTSPTKISLSKDRFLHEQKERFAATSAGEASLHELQLKKNLDRGTVSLSQRLKALASLAELAVDVAESEKWGELAQKSSGISSVTSSKYLKESPRGVRSYRTPERMNWTKQESIYQNFLDHERSYESVQKYEREKASERGECARERKCGERKSLRDRKNDGETRISSDIRPNEEKVAELHHRYGASPAAILLLDPEPGNLVRGLLEDSVGERTGGQGLGEQANCQKVNVVSEVEGVETDLQHAIEKDRRNINKKEKTCVAEELQSFVDTANSPIIDAKGLVSHHSTQNPSTQDTHKEDQEDLIREPLFSSLREEGRRDALGGLTNRSIQSSSSSKPRQKSSGPVLFSDRSKVTSLMPDRGASVPHKLRSTVMANRPLPLEADPYETDAFEPRRAPTYKTPGTGARPITARLTGRKEMQVKGKFGEFQAQKEAFESQFFRIAPMDLSEI